MAQTASISAAARTKESGSPDSLPTIATSSVTSSEGESDTHMSPRVLFKDPSNDMTKKVVENIHTMIEGKNSMIEKKITGTAAISISSSASTEVASWNLSQVTTNDPNKKNPKPATTRTISNTGVSTVNSDDDEDEETVDGSVGAFPTAEMRKLNKRSMQSDDKTTLKACTMASIPVISPSTKPSIIMEDPPTDTISCNRAAMSMTPKQLTEIFNSFDGNKAIRSMREQYSSQGPNDASKEEASASPTSIAAETVRSTAARWMDGWMPHNENLEKEHQALKEVLEDNSNKMLNLREAVETQRALNALKEVEIEDKEKELQAMRTELEDLVLQKELFVEREQELLETIEELTDKVDDLIERSCNAEHRTKLTESCLNAHAEMEPFDEPKVGSSFCIDLEPFDEAEDSAACIRQQESLISGLRNNLKAKDKEIYLLKELVEETQTKNAIQKLQMKDFGAAVKAKDGEILSLKARLEVAMVELAKTEYDKNHTHDLVVSESVGEKVNSSPSLTGEDDENNSNDDSEGSQEESLDEESNDFEDRKSAFDQENTPLSPPPHLASMGLDIEPHKKLERKGCETEKPITSRAFPSDRSLALRRSIEQKGPNRTTRGRSPTPVSESSMEDEELAPAPSPVLPTPQVSPLEPEERLMAISNLSKPIDAVESESRWSSFSDASRNASCEISIVVGKGQENDDPRKMAFKEEEEEECPGTIEVMLEGQTYGDLDACNQLTVEKAASDGDKDSCCCWSVAVTGDLE